MGRRLFMESGLLVASLTRSVFRSRRGMLEEAVCHLAGPRGTPRRESAQEGLKIVHGDSPAETVLRRRDGEGRVSLLEGLWPQDLIQLRKWR